MVKSWVKDCFEELMNLEACTIEKLEQGLSLAEKYHVITVNKEYMIKVTSEQLDLKNYEVLKSMYESGIPVIAALKWRNYTDKKNTVLIFDWVPGVNLETVLKECSSEQKKEYGVLAAKVLRQFHEFPVDLLPNYKSPYSLFKRYKFCLFSSHVSYPYKKEMDKYVKNKKNEFKNCTRYTMTHQDFRPENILVYKGELYLVDFETAYISDPYSDFVFCISIQPDEHIKYSLALINEYFESKVPNEFWSWTCFYCIMAIQKYAIWKFRRKRKMVRYQAEHLYDLYAGMKSTVPEFWRS